MQTSPLIGNFSYTNPFLKHVFYISNELIIMKNWQAIALCFSIIISVAASAFYLKYEPQTIIKSDSGIVDLGKVFAENVMIDIVWLDYAGNEKKFVEGVNFYDSTQPIAKALVDLNNERNKTVSEKKKTTYNKIDDFDVGVDRVIIRTYITYFSSNFQSTPYTLVVGEEKHTLQNYKPLLDGVYSIVNRSFKAHEEEIENNLFMTNKDV